MFFLLQIELIDRVDDIYRNTTWNKDFKGYGVQIHQVCVVHYGVTKETSLLAVSLQEVTDWSPR